MHGKIKANYLRLSAKYTIHNIINTITYLQECLKYVELSEIKMDYSLYYV